MSTLEAVVWALLGGCIAEAVPFFRLLKTEPDEAERLFRRTAIKLGMAGMAFVGAVAAYAQWNAGIIDNGLVMMESAAVGPALVERWLDRSRENPGSRDIEVDPPLQT